MNDLEMPIIIPLLDITQRKTIYYSSRTLNHEFTFYSDRLVSEAVRSSCSLPIIFIPNKIKINNIVHHMMDGGITTNTAVTETFQAMRRSSNFHQKREADLWIEVDVKKTRVFDNKNALDYCEQCGYDAVMDLAKRGILINEETRK